MVRYYKSKLARLLIFLAVFSFAFYIYNLDSVDEESPADAFCPPKLNIAFLKTHKTAGTTVQNIFFRFADKYERVVAIPFLVQHLGYIQRFQPSLVFKLKPTYRNHIFAHHAIFDYEPLRAALPEDAAFVTVLREPVAQFESAFSYFYFQALYDRNISQLAELKVEDPEWLEVKDGRKKERYGRNQQAFDLGLDPDLFDDPSAVADKVSELDRQFDLVMITELLDESVILLMQKLCWTDISDVISFKNYARTESYKAELSPAQKDRLREMNSADHAIYEHFRRKLLDEIEAFGKERMAREVQQLRVLTKQMSDFCLEENQEAEVDKKTKKPKKFVAFKLKQEAHQHKICRDLTKGDWPYTLDLLDKQRDFYEGQNVQISGLESVFREKLQDKE